MLISRLLASLSLTALVLLGCTQPQPQPSASQGKLKVVTSVAPITSVVENIGGNKISLTGIIPDGVDSHTVEPGPSVPGLMTQADLVVLNGLYLEEPTLKVAESNKKKNARILLLGDRTITKQEWLFDFTFPELKGRPNPHLWMDPNYALRYAELVHDELVRLDPANRDYYKGNLSKFRERIEQLDRGVRASILTIPPSHRKLLTYHDSFAYFARRYGMEVIGAVQPSDFSEPSAREVAQLIDQVKGLKLPAIFGSEVFPSKVLEQIARESGAKYVDKLRDDELPGKPGEPRHSYIGLILEDMENMVPNLGGNVDALQRIDPSSVFGGAGEAVYPR